MGEFYGMGCILNLSLKIYIGFMVNPEKLTSLKAAIQSFVTAGLRKGISVNMSPLVLFLFPEIQIQLC